MDFEKDAFEDDSELTPLEDEEETSGGAGELIEADEVEISVTEEPAPAAQTKKPARKKAKKAKKTKKAARKARPKKKAAKKRKTKRGKKAAKKRKRR
jgi:hypothetical protein